jgi:alpha-L-rhamnosidase
MRSMLRAAILPVLLLSSGALRADDRSPLSLRYLSPTRILWQSASGVQNPETLLKSRPGQALLVEPVPPCILTSDDRDTAGVLLDFGTELNGYVEIFTPLLSDKKVRRVHVRFGESASEAMAPFATNNAGNDHAVRDQIVTLPWLGKITLGPGGFRFVRIDAEPGEPAAIAYVRAVLAIRDLSYVGSFRCDDERLNRIWKVGAYTVHLNMQEFLWDGIKRDRLVWIGDMHPEVSTINAVFGYNEVVPASLDLVRATTPPGEWMNDIGSYSMWWVLIQEDWWMHHGRREYLEAQKPYLATLLKRLAASVDSEGKEKLDGHRFLDWPTSENPAAIHAGLQGLLLLTLEAGERLMGTLGDSALSRECGAAATMLRRHVPDTNRAKQAAALLVLSGLADPKKTSRDELQRGGARDISTFYGYYVLKAMAKAGDFGPALDLIRTYWGAMLDLGATTFWEHFDIDWAQNAGRIDELVPPGRRDIHAEFGDYCYLQLRHSLCHGWASGPTAWLSEYVLGVNPIEPGCSRVRVAPHLGGLKWAEGTYPTPLGPIRLRHELRPDGTVKSDIQAPAGVAVEYGDPR